MDTQKIIERSERILQNRWVDEANGSDLGPSATPSQRAAVEYLRREIILHDGSRANPGEYEYKRFQLTTTTNPNLGLILVFVDSVVGLKGDEGTHAELYGRTHRLIKIGKRGGLKLMNYDKEKYGEKAPVGNRVAWALVDRLSRGAPPKA